MGLGSTLQEKTGENRSTKHKRVGLALGGGGARGMAHVGVLRVLEMAGIPIDCVAGTSAGSLVGAVYAAGLRGDRLMEMALSLRWHHIANLVWPRRGLISFAKMEKYMAEQIGDLAFADLEIPYAAVAADLATGEQVVLRDGRVAPAVRASCSVPGLVTPVEIAGRLLTDGGIVNNLPISVVRALGADVVIAVGLGQPPGDYPRSPLQVAMAALDFLLIHAADDPATADVHIPIPVWGMGSLVRTSRRHRVLALGRKAAEEALPTIKAALE
jgi:NTE family protein